ncbi:MAG TPA: tRNA (adenosine(37)-N6)-dimethylallyltransferase MiaA [Gammaproteobacteria bacterium]|nr:tRNA (adenosine(37)-N6)-dimethylallyltransferase MiaA [Gammaproteobacteria bacterium]
MNSGAGAIKADAKPAVLCISGPTGMGKSELALVLAEELPLEIVSVDSAMIFRGMDIGTAKPNGAARARVPHHLIDIRDPAESYSAGEFARDARRIIGEIQDRGRTALLVGGTLLYFGALLRGLSPLPGANRELREEIRREAAARGWESLHRELAKIDPASAERIHANDPQRLERAFELYRLTGLPPSRLYEQEKADAPFRFRRFALWPEDRARLYARLGERFEAMMRAGLAGEVRALRARGDLTDALPALRVVGYRQLWGWLEGQYGEEEACRRAVVATRRYAKRQLTWLRAEAQWQRFAGVEEAKTRILAGLRGRFSDALA